MMPLRLNTSRMTQVESGVNIVLSSCCRIAVELLSLFGVSYLLQGLEGWVPPLPTPTRAKTTRASGTPAPGLGFRDNPATTRYRVGSVISRLWRWRVVVPVVARKLGVCLVFRGLALKVVP